MAGVLEGLPKPFVEAMRTLFDIMDDKGTGLISLTEIEKRWRDDGTKGLPKGVIQSLKKVTPSNGLLSFERFCTGLKICLLKNQNNDRQPPRPPSAPLIETVEPQVKAVPTRPKYAQRTVSMPQLLSKEEANECAPVKTHPVGPPKPPRLNLDKGLDKLEIRTALQNWHMAILQSDKRFPQLGRTVSRSMGDGKSAVTGDQHKKVAARRREPRRHTLQNGIDYNMLRRMKQLEQEKEILFQGLQAVERAREWYNQQLATVNDKMRFLGRDSCYQSDQWTEAQNERLGMQRARVLEVNRQLAALADQSVPLHMNLAVGGATEAFMGRLKQHNSMLTEEVRKKNEVISCLEREKSSLIREVYQLRAHNGT